MELSSDAVAVIGFVTLFALMLLRVPVGMAMGLVGVTGFGYLTGTTPALKMIGQTSMRIVTDYTFGVIPMFLLMGSFVSRSGMSRELFQAANRFVGHWRGGLGIATIAACAAPAEGRDETWINPTIEHLFTDLHRSGFAHSVECRKDGDLVGGLYGVAIGGAFFGESMFSRARDASKVALVHLVARLRLGGFTLLDTQFITSHLTQFGAIEIPRVDYRARLAEALTVPALWLENPPDLETAIRALRAVGSDPESR